MAFFHIKAATKKLKPVEDLLQHFTFFDASSESLTLIGVDITRENLHQGLPGVRVCVCGCVGVGVGVGGGGVSLAACRASLRNRVAPCTVLEGMQMDCGGVSAIWQSKTYEAWQSLAPRVVHGRHA